MPCYHPLTGYRSKFKNESGKRSIVFNTQDGYQDLKVEVPCGRCIGCRLEYSRQWAVRCMHEAQMHEANSFITLTYNNEHLPEDQSIHKEELQKFFKRLRKNLHTKYSKLKLPTPEIRYFACGEYGEKGRAHYHAIIFGYDFPDKLLFTKTKNGDLLFRSQELEKAWSKDGKSMGFSTIGNATFESCAYVARYVMKKRKGDDDTPDPVTGKTNKEYYLIVDDETGETWHREPEFCLMSRRPGLGKTWLEKFKQDTDKDFITVNYSKQKLPKYYDSILEQEDALAFEIRKRKRKKEAKKRADDNTPDRLAQKETCKIAQSNQLKREID